MNYHYIFIEFYRFGREWNNFCFFKYSFTAIIFLEWQNSKFC